MVAGTLVDGKEVNVTIVIEVKPLVTAVDPMELEETVTVLLNIS